MRNGAATGIAHAPLLTVLAVLPVHGPHDDNVARKNGVVAAVVHCKLVRKGVRGEGGEVWQSCRVEAAAR